MPQEDPQQLMQPETDGVVCAICLASYCGRVYLSPCFHSFCASCIAAWLDITLLCPLCKTRPLKLHWGVNTRLGILNTIEISHGSTFTSMDTNHGAGSLSPSSLRIRHVNNTSGSWRAALAQVVKCTAERTNKVGLSGSDELQNHNKASESGLSATDAKGSEELEGSESEVDSALMLDRKRRLGETVSQVVKRTRSRSSTRSRSRSVTPIDSYHYEYESPSLYASLQAPSSTPSATSLHNNHQTQGDAAAIRDLELTRRDVYVHGMEPYPIQNFPLADRILSSDVALLTPFLERDLAVLTDASPSPVDPIVLAHVGSILLSHEDRVYSRDMQTHDKKAVQGHKWHKIARDISQWITLTPKAGLTELDEAELFVREMRRVVKKRWTTNAWDSRVKYQPISCSAASLKHSASNE